jgi:hypothetical protein
MKKLVVVLLFVLSASAVFADTLNLGTFPLGKWFDSNYGAYWEFSSGNIRIVDASGKLFFDFGTATIKDFKVGAEAAGATITFSCVETGKSYKLTKPLTNLNIILEIDPPWKVHYKVEMAKQ